MNIVESYYYYYSDRVFQLPITANLQSSVTFNVSDDYSDNGVTPAVLNDPVYLIDDDTANDNDWIQATETNRPTKTADGWSFDGVDNFMAVSNWLPSIITNKSPATLYMVFDPSWGTGGDKRFLFSDNSAGNSALFIGKSVSDAYRILIGDEATNINQGLGDPVSDGLALYTIVFSTTSIALRRNSIQIVSASYPAGTMTLDRASLFSRLNGTNSLEALTEGGHMYSGEHNASQLESVENYLIKWHGIS